MIPGTLPTLVAALAVAFAAPALAETPQTASPAPGYAHNSILAGNFTAAEQTLRQQLSDHGEQPEILLNLAAILARTGRTDEARRLYFKVLQGRNVDLALASGRNAKAHSIATKGLQALPATVTAAVVR